MNDQAQVIADILDAVEPMPGNHIEQQLRDAVVDHLTETSTIIDVMPGMIVRPDDVLVLECADYVSSEVAAVIKAECFKRMPLLRDVVFLQHVHVAGVYREDES